MTTNIFRWMSTVLNLVVKFYDLTQLIFSNCISCCSFSHMLQCGQIEKLMPQLSLAHGASFYLKSSSFWKRFLKSVHPFYFGANVTSSMKPSLVFLSFLHCHLCLNPRLSEITSRFSELPKHLLCSGTHYFWLSFPSYVCVKPPPQLTLYFSDQSFHAPDTYVPNM